MANREIYRGYQETKEDNYGILDHVFFDVDSCVVGGEGIDELAKLHDCEGEIAMLTRDAMNGDTPLEYVFAERLSIIQPRKEDLEIIGRRYIETVTPHAPQTIRFLQGIGMKVWLISGGYDEAIYPLVDYIGVPRDRVFANHLYFNSNGSYLGFDETNPLCRQFGKREYIERLKKMGIVQGKIALVGDGVSEIEAKDVVDICIGFGGHVVRERVRNEANFFVNMKTFIPLVPILLQRIPK